MSTCHSILLVEDDADDRYIMHLAFAEINYADKIKVFNSGDELLKYLHSLPHSDLYPSLLVVDYNMPGLNGGELLMRLKIDDTLRDIPVVVYSTGMSNIEHKMRTLGAEYCFEKGHH